MKGYVYILQSLKNQRFYIGSTNDLERRFLEHNSGKNKYTSLNKPFKIVFSQEYDDISQARKVEFKLKSFKSRKILEKIINDGFCKINVSDARLKP
ncbi:MAG: GIY-YIG nuclease family protein [Candidatus Shapirobacteria bacterium]|jgi:putative endonuclease